MAAALKERMIMMKRLCSSDLLRLFPTLSKTEMGSNRQRGCNLIMIMCSVLFTQADSVEGYCRVQVSNIVEFKKGQLIAVEISFKIW
jgi:hypothetical protein